MSTVEANRPHSWFVRAAAVIGDLSNPFYREERQRDVWNEASAVAFQVLIWLHLLAATAAVWFVGADALPYVYALIAMIGLASWVALLYAGSLGVDVQSSGWVSWRRMLPAVVVVLLLAVGLVRIEIGHVSADDWSTVAGMVTGAAFAVGVLVAVVWFSRRRTRTDEQD